MTDNIRTLHGAPVPTNSEPFQAAVTAAIAAGAVRGVLLYETDEGWVGRQPIGVGVAGIEGLCHWTLRDLTEGEE